MDKVNYNAKSKTANKKKFVALSILVMVLLISNLIFVTVAFFTDTAKGSSIVTFGTVSANVYIMENSNKTTTINLQPNDLIAGAVTEKELHIDVTGTSDCYVRVTGEFRVAVDGTNYVNFSDMVSFSIDTTENAGWKLCADNKYYYTFVLNGTESNNASLLTVPVKFTVSENFGNSNLDGTSVYKNKPYQVIITVESCQAEGTSLGSGNQFDYTKWVSN